VIKDPDRAICGIATVFGQPSPNDGRSWKAEQFRDFLALETAVPLRVDHGPLITSGGVIMHVGMVRRFATITYPTHALLILAEVDDAEGSAMSCSPMSPPFAPKPGCARLGVEPGCAGGRGHGHALRGQRHSEPCLPRRENPWRRRASNEHLADADRAPNRS